MINESNTIYTSKLEEFTLTKLELSPWKCHLFGDDKGYGITYKPQKGAEPNWFWRMTQHLILGHKWVKEVSDEPVISVG